MSDTLDESYVPLDCPFCERMMRDMNDCVQYHISGCCVECWIAFLEPLRKINEDAGYLPTEAELKEYRKKVREMSNTETANVKH